MRNFILLLTVTLATFSFKGIESKTGILGTIIDTQGEPVIVAAIALYQAGDLITGTESDFDGNFFFTGIDPGIYDVEASYVGHQTQRITGVVIRQDSFANLKIVMTETVMLEEVVIMGYKAPLVKYDNTTQGSTLISEKIKALPNKSISAIATTSAGISVSGSDISIGGGRYGATVYYIDGIRVDAAQADKMVPQAQIDVVSESEPSLVEEIPEAGQLTAGEWNDLKNWDTWNELVEAGEYQEMAAYWGSEELVRESVFVTNANNIPLVNQRVELVSADGKVLWSALSDNGGSAELWSPQNVSDFEILVNNQKVMLNKSEHNADSHHIIVDQPCATEKSLDVMFVVDVTSSMSDEIDYLKSELADVIKQVEEVQQEQGATLRMGTVFYKDHQDIIPTAVSPLQEDVTASLEFIKTERVGSTTKNRDIPEAVEFGLEDALAQDWNMEATNRIIFLVLDAPPRHQDSVMVKINEQIKRAAGMGIKIIPITASGIDRPTEYLMKQMAVLTNGTYVFLTDDSGIGNAHLEHVVSDYDVEFLNDLLVRVITGYAKSYDCDDVEDEQLQVANIDLKVYPNPTVGQLTVKTKRKVDKILVSSASGNSVMTVNSPKKKTQINLSALISGMYQLSVIVDGQRVETQNVIKI